MEALGGRCAARSSRASMRNERGPDTPGFDSRHDTVVMIAVDAILRRRSGTETVAAGHRCVIADREAALARTQSHEGDVVCGGFGMVRHVVFQSSGHLPARAYPLEASHDGSLAARLQAERL